MNQNEHIQTENAFEKVIFNRLSKHFNYVNKFDNLPKKFQKVFLHLEDLFDRIQQKAAAEEEEERRTPAERLREKWMYQWMKQKKVLM